MYKQFTGIRRISGYFGGGCVCFVCRFVCWCVGVFVSLFVGMTIRNVVQSSVCGGESVLIEYRIPRICHPRTPKNKKTQILFRI